MIKTMKPICKLTMLVLLAISSGLQAQRHRPQCDFTTDTLMVHDPVMAWENGTYHLFCTGMGVQHATSKDLKTWTDKVNPVMSVIPKWTHDSVPGFSRHVWAPDIIKYRDKWWMAYSCSTFGKNTSAIGLLSAQSLDEGEIWNDEGSIVCSKEGRDNWNAIDPNFVIDDNGEPWLTFGSFWDGIQLVKLDTTMHIAKGQKMKTIARRKYVDTMENPVEAPFIFKHGSYYYLFVSWDYCCKGMNSSYKVVVGRSRYIEGPYLDRNGKDMADLGGTLVIEGDKKEYEAAGHCSAYTFQGKDYFVCHGYSVALKGASILICKEITWTEDGWPTIKGK